MAFDPSTAVAETKFDPTTAFDPESARPVDAAPQGSNAVINGRAVIPGAEAYERQETPGQVAEQRRLEVRRRHPVLERVGGAVEAALEISSQLLGGVFGGGAGFLGIGTEQAGEKGMAEGAQRGVQGVRDVMRTVGLTKSAEGPQTATGQELTEGFGKAMESVPPVAGVFGTLAGPMAAAPRQAVRPAVGQAAANVADAAIEAATPRLSPATMARVGKAVETGIPISPHQISGNRFLKLLGETAENLPGAGGETLRATRREKFSTALAKQLDPDTDITVLDESAFAQLQDAAGEKIGEISSKYSVPIDDFGDVTRVARRDTPDVQTIVKGFADDLKAIADQNGGTVPGDTLRKLRTEAQSRARESTNNRPDLKRALDDMVKRFDDALTSNALPEDAEALASARRRYAISKTLEPLVAKHGNGDFPPAALRAIVGRKAGGGERRLARGEAGDMGEYARIGQELLKEPVSSYTAERSLVYRGIGSVAVGGTAAMASLPAAAAMYGGAAIYNLLGPKLVKRMVEAEKRRTAAREEPPRPPAGPAEPTLGQGFEDVPQGRLAAQPGALGDLTPDWETAPGAMPEGAGAAAGGALEAEPGLVPALGDQPPTTGPRAALTERAGQQIPAVPGRPDLPDTLVSGAPAESAATDAANVAMMDAGAIEARRQQAAVAEAQAPLESIPVGEATEIVPENVKPAPEVREHPEVAKVKAEIEKKRAAEAKKQADADELRSAAAAEKDPEIKAALLARAEKIKPTPKSEKIPTGEATELDVETVEAPNAPGEISKQEGVQRERATGDEGGQAAEASGGDRVQRAEKGAGKEDKALDLFPKIDEAFLDQQQRVAERAAAESAPPPTNWQESRGRRQTRAVLEKGLKDGSLNPEGVQLALWALDKNPNLARGLRTEVEAAGPGMGRGAYNSALKLVSLFEGKTAPQTVIHEIFHHAERMMPPAVQQGIRRAWERGLKNRMRDAPPEKRRAMEAMDRASGGDEAAMKEVRQAFKDGLLTQDDYQFVNPTEYWAVNAARVLHERFTGRGSWRAQAKQWLKEMTEHLKGVLNLGSDAAVLKAMKQILDPEQTTGMERSKSVMIKGERSAKPPEG